MSKVVEEVGIGAALVGANFLLPGMGIALSGAMSSFLATTGAGFVLSGIGTLLGQKASGIHTTSRNPLQPWQIIYGRKKVGGTIVYQEEVASNNRILLLVIAVAAHPCQEIEAIWFNNKALQLQLNTEFSDEANPNGFWQSFDPPQGNWQIETISRTNDIVSVTFAQNPNSHLSSFNGQTFRFHGTVDAAGGSTFEGYYPVVQTSDNTLTFAAGGPQGAGEFNTGTMTSTWPQYKGTVTAGYYLGDQTEACGIVYGNTVGYWTSQCLLTGITYVGMKILYDSGIYSGIPEISFVVQGKNNIYDPRTNSYGYTNNAALVIADYLAQPVWGFGAQYGTQIPTAPLIAAANLCDTAVTLAGGGSEPMYRCDGAFDVSVKRGEVLQNLLTSCGGRLVEMGGQFFIQPAAWVTPSGAITIGTGNTGPKMMMNSDGLVAQYYNNPAGVYVPDCAGTTTSQFIYTLGLLNAYQATGNSNAKILAQLALSAIEPYLFRNRPIPPRVTASNIWSPNWLFGVKQAFLGDGGVTLSVTEDFASDFATPAGWRALVGQEVQTACDSYNWAIRLFAAAALVLDNTTSTGAPNLGYGNNPYGTAPYGDPEQASATINSNWVASLNAILQMAALAYNVNWPPTLTAGNHGIKIPSFISVMYQGGMIPFAAEMTGQPAPALTGWIGPAYTGYQSPWAVKQVNPSTAGGYLVGVAVTFLHDAQAAFAAQGTNRDTVVFTVAGPNAQTLSVPIDVSAAGTASASFSYAGLNAGTDTIVATLPSHSLTSNAAEIAWSPYSVPLGVFNVYIAVMAADGSGLFNGATAVLSSTPVQGLMFNSHPQSTFPGDPHQSGNQANPFVSNAVGTAGEYEGDQAIPNTGGQFNAVITGSFTVETPGDVTFTVLVNSAFVIGIKGATYVSGQQSFGALSGGTAINNYPPLAGLNSAGDWPGGNWATVTFAAGFSTSGIFDFEVDFASGLFGEREFVLLGPYGVIPNIAVADAGGAAATGTAPSGQLQLTPYAGGDAIGQTQAFTLSLTGISYTAPGTGPFAPVFYFAQPAANQSWGPVNTWGWAGPDPNTTAGYYQYRPLAELADLIASCNGTETYYSTASAITTAFLSWINTNWVTAAAGPPNYFPQHGGSVTAPDVQCAALILHAVMALDLAARPMGGGTMNATQLALLNKVYAMYQAIYLTSGPMGGTFCQDPSGAQDWSPIWAGEILRSLSMLVTWAGVNAQAAMRAQAIIWIDGLVNFGLNSVVVVDPDLGYTVNDLRDAVTWRPKLARPDLFNGVKGTYVSEANQWQQSDFPSYAQDTLHGYTNGTAAHDNDANWDADGQRLWKDVQLPFTTSVSMAQRLAKIELLRIRQQGRGLAVGMMTMYKSAPLDTVYFSYAPFAWVNKVLEIANCRLIQSKARAAGGQQVTLLGTELDIQEADPSVYAWSATEELSAQGYSYLPGLQNVAPD